MTTQNQATKAKRKGGKAGKWKPAKPLTATSIRSFKKPGEYGDANTVGLHLRVSAAGSKTFRYRYKLRGKTRVMTLGRFGDDGLSLADARRLATAHHAKVEKGDDPAVKQQKERAAAREMPTVEEFVEVYIGRYAKKEKKTWRQDEQLLSNWVLPKIGRLRMNEVTRRDIVKIVDDCRDAGNVRQPGKVLAVTRKMFNFAIQRGEINATPCTLVEESQPAPAQKAMTRDEICEWWAATGDAIASDNPAIQKSLALALRVLLLTGQRPGEVAGMTRDELHLDDSELGAHWRIPAVRRRKGRNGKGTPHAVTLEPKAVAAIKAALELSSGRFVFENTRGGPVGVDAMKTALDRIFKRPPPPTLKEARERLEAQFKALEIEIQDADIDEIFSALDIEKPRIDSLRRILKSELAVMLSDEHQDEIDGIVEGVYPTVPTPHAARHTVATELEELDVAESHIGRVLGHASKSVTGQVYVNKRLNERALNNQRRHVAAWEARLLEIVSGDEGASNVVSMGARS